MRRTLGNMLGRAAAPLLVAEQGTLPRTGAAIGGLVLLGLGLVFGGRLLQRRGTRL